MIFEVPYEAEAWNEIRAWEQRPDRRLTAPLRLAGKPAAYAVDQVMKWSAAERAAQRLNEALEGATTRLGVLIDKQAVLKALAESAGSPVSSLAEVRGIPLALLDANVRGLDKRYIAGVSASGGSTGAIAAIPGVGMPLAIAALGADIGMTVTTLLTASAHYAVSYGRELSSPQEQQFAVGVMALGSVATDSQARQAMLVDLHAVGLLLAKKATWTELEKHASVRALRQASRGLNVTLTKRKLGPDLAPGRGGSGRRERRGSG